MTAAASDQSLVKTSVGASVGGANTGVPVSSATNTLVPAITDIQRLAGGFYVLKVCWLNNNPTDAWSTPTYWAIEGAGVTVDIGLGLDDGDDAASTQGNMVALSTNSVLTYSSSASDTRVVTAVGLNAAGAPVSETVTLNGVTAVVGTQVFSVVYGASVSAIGSQTVTIADASPTTIGTIGPTFKTCWLWVHCPTQGEGILLVSLAATLAYCFWYRVTWIAGAPGERPNIDTFATVDS